MYLSVISLLVSGVALWVALRRREPTQTPVRKPDTADRRQQAIARREWINFMHYDGTPQPPIDPNTPM